MRYDTFQEAAAAAEAVKALAREQGRKVSLHGEGEQSVVDEGSSTRMSPQRGVDLWTNPTRHVEPDDTIPF